MDSVTLVDDQIDDGQRLLDQLGEDRSVARAAGWVKPAEEGRWSLYIVSPIVDKDGPLEGYRRVLDVLRSLPESQLTSSDIKLVGEKHPVARDLLDLIEKYPGRTPPRSRRSLLGGIPVDEVYVYPPPGRKPVEVTIYGLIFRGDPTGSLHLSFEPQNPDTQLMVGKPGNETVYPAQTGLDWVVATPAGATLEPDRTFGKVLAWDLRGTRERSNANDVLSLAELGLHGFRVRQRPVGLASAP